MANSSLFIHWNKPTQGREKASDAFLEEVTKFLGSKKEVESYETVLLQQRGHELNGFILVRGSRQGLTSLQDGSDWRMLVAKASIIMDGFGIVPGFVGDSIASESGAFLEAHASL